ncbi:MAG: hypothetical protein LUH15_19350 [Tannerellaceae bacterium]|nr:hypothetical protein [Tannerellaceae bacterium]
MKEYKKEIIVCFIALIAAGGAFWFFTYSLQQEKKAVQTELLHFVSSHITALFRVNRISLFEGVISGDTTFSDSWSQLIPDIFRTILHNQPELSPVLFSFSPQGVVFYANTTHAQAALMKDRVLSAVFPWYPPYNYEKYGILFSYYTDTEDRFFGCYYVDGVWVGSYSRKLLEESLRCYLTDRDRLQLPANTYRIDPESPANLYLRSESLDLCFREEDNPAWMLTDYWINSDIFIGKSNICLFTTFPNDVVPEEWADVVRETFTDRINNFIPGMNLQYQLPEQEDPGDIFYYTACTPGH